MNRAFPPAGGKGVVAPNGLGEPVPTAPVAPLGCPKVKPCAGCVEGRPAVGLAGDAGWLPENWKGLEGAEVGVDPPPKVNGAGWLGKAGLAGLEVAP